MIQRAGVGLDQGRTRGIPKTSGITSPRFRHGPCKHGWLLQASNTPNRHGETTMTRTTLRHALLLGTAATVASLGYIGSADAAYPAVMKITPGIGGPMEKDGGAGSEQSSVAVFEKDGKEYVVSIYMSSNVS